MNEQRWHMPLLNHLITFAKQRPQSFHVPGHRNGAAWEHFDPSMPLVYKQALRKIAQLDVTELSHTDDLHDPTSIIEEAQQLAASLYGVDHTFFLVAGSTIGNIALILACCEPGDIIIMQRNAHKSLINGCKLAGARVVFIDPDIETATNIAIAPSYECVEQAIKMYPEAKAVFITNPNYYGLSVDLYAITELVHRHHMIMLVDEAHGAHYSVAPYAPTSAIGYGADGVVHSAHKTLPALTMSAMLHIQGNRISKAVVQQQLAMLESSSPSYLLLAGLDYARAFMQYAAKQQFEHCYQLMNTFIVWLRSNTRFDCKQFDQLSHIKQDPYRMLIYDRSNQWSGYALLRLFEEQQIWAEMASDSYVVMIWHPFISEEDIVALQQGLLKIEQHMVSVTPTKEEALERSKPVQFAASTTYNISEPITYHRIAKAKSEYITIEQSIGRQCAELIIPYPPGIPYIYEGEKITQQHINRLLAMKQHNVRMQGSIINKGLIKVFEQ